MKSSSSRNSSTVLSDWPIERPYDHDGVRRYYPDRNGRRFGVGDTVYLIPAMRVSRVRKALVTAINGDDIWVVVNLGRLKVRAHRYGCEMEVAWDKRL